MTDKNGTEREYLGTHPWINFSPDLRQLSPRAWMLLGEAQSKCQHIAGVPLKPALAKELHLVSLSRGALATTAIEGNTLSEEDARKIAEGKFDAPPSREYLKREIENIIGAYNRIMQMTFSEGCCQLTPQLIMEFNKEILEGLPRDDRVEPGKIRTYSVGVGRYRAAPASDCAYLLERLCGWLEREIPREIIPGARTATAIIKAILAHVYLAWIHPFGDGNGRTARLVELMILLAGGAPSPAALVLSNHYNATRSEYYRILDETSRSKKGDVTGFIEYAVQGFVDHLQAQLDEIRLQQWMISWETYVHEQFAGKDSPAASRQRQLLLTLSGAALNGVQKKDISGLSPEMMRHYALKTSKTLTRDINALEKLGLMERTKQGYRAKMEVILAFLPRRVE